MDKLAEKESSITTFAFHAADSGEMVFWNQWACLEQINFWAQSGE